MAEKPRLADRLFGQTTPPKPAADPWGSAAWFREQLVEEARQSDGVIHIGGLVLTVKPPGPKRPADAFYGRKD